ncbi:MBL fold metallo-hydrolase [Roseobacter sp. HKCCA0434]|uniref:MBL fold metallo-hydrolase n=1 Tax=Roseobacter sp. HKCCA0434 TaxID=3079297 RepID=UPI002905F1D8|nr:MBL fold metallo-hydrolase [Roseobacter sp. HKCCA0434]
MVEGLRRITAPNGGPMTHTGTQSYLLGTGEVALIDAGPDLPAHRAAILDALAPGERITHLLATHAHLDHTPLATRLGRELDIPVLAFGRAEDGRRPVMQALAGQGRIGGGEGVDADFAPDMTLSDGETVVSPDWTLEVWHTPGHMAGHLCFLDRERGILFTGDHVMGWASTLVSPPDGDLTAFMASLRRMQGRCDGLTFHPGHGEPVVEAERRIAELIAHREMREAQVMAALESGPVAVEPLTARIYTDVAPTLLPAAARNVLAHLIDLTERGLVRCDGPISPEATWSRA